MGMSRPKSPPALRILLTVSTVLGGGDSLESLNTQLVMDRGLVAVVANNSLYMLRRDATDAPSGTDIVEPSAGPGRWFVYAAGGGSTLPAFGMVTAPNGDSAPTFTYDATFQPVQAEGDSLVYAGSDLFAIETDPPHRLVYTGPDCRALVRCVATVPVLTGNFSQQLAISLSGDLDGGALDSDAALVAGAQGAQNANDEARIIVPMVTERLVTLTSGAIVGAVFGSHADAGPIGANGYSLSVQVVGPAPPVT